MADAGATRLGWRRWLALGVALGLFVFDVLGHEWISRWCDTLSTEYGFGVFDHRARLILVIVCIGVVAGALIARRKLLHTRVVLGVASLAVVSTLAHRFLIVNNVELVHLPQYALLAALFLAGGLSPRAALACTALAGILDELHQYQVGTGLRPELTYLDYNDMLLNLLGGTWAIVLAAPAHLPALPAPSRRARVARWSAAALFLAGAAVLAAVDPPGWTVHYGAFERAYYVLSSSLAVVLAAVLWAVPCYVIPRK